MDLSNLFALANPEYVEQLFSEYQRDPNSVDEKWRVFFAGFELGLGRPAPAGSRPKGEFSTLSQRRSDGVGDLVHSFRELGHFAAKLDPLGSPRDQHPLLDLREFGFSSVDLTRKVGNGGFLGETDGTLGDLVEKLKATYCGTIGVQYLTIPDKDQRAWLQERMEPTFNRPHFSRIEKHQILKSLCQAEGFEQFLHSKYVGQKRFSVEGGEAVVPMLEAVLDTAAADGAKEMVLGMAHRGRLNVLAHTMKKPYELILSEFEGSVNWEYSQGDGDVKYHKGYSCDRETWNGHKVHCSLNPNPSHLELVNPVVEGVVYAKQKYLNDSERTQVIPILIHGDAAFVGQGIVPETLSLSQLEGYRTGGTVHIIINNQLGFTATAAETRFTPYPTDVAKMIQAPVFHVNGDDPEAVVMATKLAVDFRQAFKSDVFLDLWCYRKYGHNETDEPTFTSPMMYKIINEQKPVTTKYAEQLMNEGSLTESEWTDIQNEVKAAFDRSLQVTKAEQPLQKGFTFGGAWTGMSRAGDDWSAKTEITKEKIAEITQVATRGPEGFHVHRKLKKIMEQREAMGAGSKNADWGTAEMWAFGSLLQEGTSVRLAGQDCGRGTFSHRHAVFHDEENGETYVPLKQLAKNGSSFTIINSMLSELAVLGFEYGFSLADPRNLTLWEAQFGDFVNGAQPIIDQFIVSSETKWQKMSGLVMLLPHGYEGQGPEHSSARLERFLQLCGENNIQVAYPTLPAQYFHLLRRQIHRPFRKPLVLMMPKSLLRDERSSSPLSEFTDLTFRTVIDDSAIEDPKSVKRVIFCTGKVFFALQAHQQKNNIKDVALVRVEQLYPFPKEELKALVAKYSKASTFFWTQEEPKNMGAWNFIEPRLSSCLPESHGLYYRGRKESASPAAGIFHRHQQEEAEIVNQSFEKI
jgi:2-oxoglutarate dehydrogenase E1 component